MKNNTKWCHPKEVTSEYSNLGKILEFILKYRVYNLLKDLCIYNDLQIRIGWNTQK